MGCYINPQNVSKDVWLDLNGERTSAPCEISESFLPVCLVDNGPFTAAAVAYDSRELEAFDRPDDFRRKKWFKVRVADLLQVCDLKNYLR